MKRLVTIIASAVLALTLGACSGGASNPTSGGEGQNQSTAQDTGATEETTQAIVIDKDAKTITINASSTGFKDDSIHFLVNKDGKNAGKSRFITEATPTQVHDALEQIGATPGNNIKLEDETGTIEGSDLKVVVRLDGNDYDPMDFISASDTRPLQVRFGGNKEANEKAGTGCIFCLESCPLGIISNASYAFQEPIKFEANSQLPAAGTTVQFVISLV